MTLELIPSIKTGKFRNESPESEMADSKYAKKRRTVLEKANYTCQGCNFKTLPDRSAQASTLMASGYFEVHHLDDDHSNQDFSNLVVLCPLCHMVFHVGFGAYNKTYSLIYFPWLSQAQINILSICAGVIICRNKEKNSQFYNDALGLMNYLASFNETLQINYGEPITQPVQFATALSALSKTPLYNERQKALKDFRLLPDITKFKTVRNKLDE